MNRDLAFNLLHSKLEAKLVGFDPTVIIGIISAIMEMIGGCKKDAETSATTIKAACKKASVMHRVVLNQALRGAGLRPLTAEGRRAAQACLDVGKEASEDEVAGFMACCEG